MNASLTIAYVASWPQMQVVFHLPAASFIPHLSDVFRPDAMQGSIGCAMLKTVEAAPGASQCRREAACEDSWRIHSGYLRVENLDRSAVPKKAACQ